MHGHEVARVGRPTTDYIIVIVIGHSRGLYGKYSA